MVKCYKHLNVNDSVDPKEFTRDQNKENITHCKCVNEKEENDWNRIKKGDLKGCTGALVFSAQKQALRTNCSKCHVDNTIDSRLCRMCWGKGETVSHNICEDI